MCVPGCQEKVISNLSRRGFLTAAGSAAAALTATGCLTLSVEKRKDEARSFRKVFDLTHTLTPDFPSYSGDPQLEVEALFTVTENGYSLNRWHLSEHTGTHLDAPIHFANDVLSADRIPVDDLVVPLAIVDIRDRARKNPDTQVTPDDLREWTKQYGPFPAGACIAMNSGWDRKINSPSFRNVDEKDVMHFPGFHQETAIALLEDHDIHDIHDIKGLAVDTLSLDHGPSSDFATHTTWLPRNRWGLECIKGLSDLPAIGATLVVGGPKIAGATGGMSRVFALV